MGIAEIILAVMTILLGGGFITGVVTVIKARKQLPAETDNMIVTGAQGAIVAMDQALKAETARADRAELEASKLRGEKENLLAKIDQMQDAIDSLQEQLDEFKRTVVNTLEGNPL